MARRRSPPTISKNFVFFCPPVDKHFRKASEIIFKPMQKFARNTEMFFEISKKFQKFRCFRKSKRNSENVEKFSTIVVKLERFFKKFLENLSKLLKNP